jgi:hypothetical protein
VGEFFTLLRRLGREHSGTSGPTFWARRFWLPIVNPLFHGSFGRRHARNSFEPYGLVAMAIRVSPPDGEVIPPIETNTDLVLEA